MLFRSGCSGNQAIQSVDASGSPTCSSSFAPASQVLSSGQVNTTSPDFGMTLLQSGNLTVSTSCETFAGEADVGIKVSSGTFSFVSDLGSTGNSAATGLPSGVGFVLGRANPENQIHFSALSSTGKTLNGDVMAIHTGSGTCTYEASGLAGG